MKAMQQQEPMWRRVGRIIGDVLLHLAAVGGAICLLLVILAFLFDITPVMFRTGSMAPTIPAGSVAVVRQIDAEQIEVGDVVTVDRADALPITHRVTSVSGTGDERVITMRGDANASDDPSPYTVTEARRVLVSVPGLARPLSAMSDPRALTAITIGVAILVTWVFWPRGHGSHGGGSRPERHREQRRRQRQGGLPRGGAAVLFVALSGLASTVPGSPGRADALAQRISGDVLRLETIADPQAMTQMSPGLTVPWQVGIWAEAPNPGTINVSWSASGDTELGLLAEVRACDTRWRSGECPGTESLLQGQTHVPWGPSEQGLKEITSDEQVWLLVEAHLSPGGTPDGQVELRVHARGFGEDVAADTGPVTHLPPTGVEWGPPVLVALAALLVGFLALAASRRPRIRR